jgi:hypothetical protein
VYAIGIELAHLVPSFIEQRNLQKTVREITVHNKDWANHSRVLFKQNEEQSLW